MFIVRDGITLRVVVNMKARVLVPMADGENSNIRRGAASEVILAFAEAWRDFTCQVVVGKTEAF